MKSAKNLLIPFIILVALIICVIAYYIVTGFKDSEPAESSSEGLINVVYYNSSDVSSLTVYNTESQHSSVVNCSYDSSNSVYYDYQGDDAVEGEKYSQTKLSDYVYNLISYSCIAKVSSDGNYAEYGLDNPKYVITINASNGTSTTVYIGNTSPDGNYCYMYVDGSADIYTVNAYKLAQAEKTAIDFLDATVLSLDYNNLSTVHFDRKTDGLSLDANVIVSDNGNADFVFYKPYNHSCSGYFCKMIDSVVDLEITEYVAINSDELASYGLDNPAYHFVLTAKNGDVTELFFSRELSGYYYGYIKGMSLYFMVSEYQLENLDLQETVLIDPYICYCYAKDISTINCTYGDKSFKFSIYVPDGESISSDRSSVELDGRNAKVVDSDGRSFSSVLFESIACISIGGSEADINVDTSSEADITLEFIDNNFTITVYEFYSRNSDSYYVFKDGEYTGFYVYSKEIFYDGGQDTYSYGFWSAYELLSEAITNSVNNIYDIPVE